MSCQKSKNLSPVDYVRWIENPSNGLNVMLEKEEEKYSLQFKPIEYIVAVQERRKHLPKEVFERAKSQMEGLQYFTFRINPDESPAAWLDQEKMSAEDYRKNVKHLSFGMQNDMTLIDGIDTLTCLLFHHEQSYKLNSSYTFLLGFEMSEESMFQSKKMIYKDETLGIGTVEFSIKEDDLINIATLNLE